MNCPKCGDSFPIVIDARASGISKRRRRECLACGHRYTTFEVYAEDFKKLEFAKKQMQEVMKIWGVQNYENENIENQG